MSYDIMTDRPGRSIWLVDTDTGAQTPLATVRDRGRPAVTRDDREALSIG